jgi:hypothetical protein
MKKVCVAEQRTLKERKNMINKFGLGLIIISTDARDKLVWEDMDIALTKHKNGDWGNGDKRKNDDAVKNGCDIKSVYSDSKGLIFWVITDGIRSATTILLSQNLNEFPSLNKKRNR